MSQSESLWENICYFKLHAMKYIGWQLICTKILSAMASYQPKSGKKAGEKYENNMFKYKVHIQIVDLNYASTKYLNIWLFDRALIGSLFQRRNHQSLISSSTF